MNQHGAARTPDVADSRHPGKSHIFPERKQRILPIVPGSFAHAGLIALHPVSGLLAGAGLGWLLHAETESAWIFPLCLLLGLGVGVMNAYRDIKAMLRRNEADDAAKKPLFR